MVAWDCSLSSSIGHRGFEGSDRPLSDRWLTLSPSTWQDTAKYSVLARSPGSFVAKRLFELSDRAGSTRAAERVRSSAEHTGGFFRSGSREPSSSKTSLPQSYHLVVSTIRNVNEMSRAMVASLSRQAAQFSTKSTQVRPSVSRSLRTPTEAQGKEVERSVRGARA